MGGEKASAAKHMDGPVTPMKRGSGLRVSIVSLDVLRRGEGRFQLQCCRVVSSEGVARRKK